MAAKVLVTEKIADEGLEILKGRGYDVVELLDAEPEALHTAIADADALIDALWRDDSRRTDSDLAHLDCFSMPYGVGVAGSED